MLRQFWNTMLEMDGIGMDSALTIIPVGHLTFMRLYGISGMVISISHTLQRNSKKILTNLWKPMRTFLIVMDLLICGEEVIYIVLQQYVLLMETIF